MTSARALEKLHKVNYYVPHVHLMRIKEGRTGQTPCCRGVSFGGLSSPLFLIPDVPAERWLKITRYSRFLLPQVVVRTPMKKKGASQIGSNYTYYACKFKQFVIVLSCYFS